jgi:hypothetical protein
MAEPAEYCQKSHNNGMLNTSGTMPHHGQWCCCPSISGTTSASKPIASSTAPGTSKRGERSARLSPSNIIAAGMATMMMGRLIKKTLRHPSPHGLVETSTPPSN